jgi:protein-S-isoprenylcysteine O-methyltransferase Ste14
MARFLALADCAGRAALWMAIALDHLRRHGLHSVGALLSGAQLERNGDREREHESVWAGPYGLVRHPIYTGLSLAFQGTSIGFGQLRGLIGFPILVLGWKYKANVEERFMLVQFGEQYERYRREVKGLIPFTW